MVMDLGRGSGGRAPLLVFGLILICVFLIFNWWSLSTQNLELFRQLEERGEHLKLGSRKILECNHVKQELEKELSSTKQLIIEVKEERDHNVDSNTRCNEELESLKKVQLSQHVLIESRRVEKEHLESELKDKKNEITRLQAELKEVQEKLNQKANQPKEVAAVAVGPPVKEENNPVNHEGRNAVDAAAAAVNNVLEQNEDTENREADNAIEDDREKEQERENARNTADVPKTS